MRKIMNEKLTITTSNPVRARFYEYPRFTYPWHFHSEYEIIYVEKGEGDCLVGDSIISYSKGDMFVKTLQDVFYNPAYRYSISIKKEENPYGCPSLKCKMYFLSFTRLHGFYIL